MESKEMINEIIITTKTNKLVIHVGSLKICKCVVDKLRNAGYIIQVNLDIEHSTTA